MIRFAKQLKIYLDKLLSTKKDLQDNLFPAKLQINLY